MISDKEANSLMVPEFLIHCHYVDSMQICSQTYVTSMRSAIMLSPEIFELDTNCSASSLESHTCAIRQVVKWRIKDVVIILPRYVAQ